jgi:hypothetical protein
MTTRLPTLELKYNKETTSNSSNTNTINNNIIIKPSSENNNIEVPQAKLESAMLPDIELLESIT